MIKTNLLEEVVRCSSLVLAILRERETGRSRARPVGDGFERNDVRWSTHHDLSNVVFFQFERKDRNTFDEQRHCKQPGDFSNVCIKCLCLFIYSPKKSEKHFQKKNRIDQGQRLLKIFIAIDDEEYLREQRVTNLFHIDFFHCDLQLLKRIRTLFLTKMQMNSCEEIERARENNKTNGSRRRRQKSTVRLPPI